VPPLAAEGIKIGSAPLSVALLMVKRYGDDAMYPTVDLKERLLTLYTWR
jgi:hypothetical protein